MRKGRDFAARSRLLNFGWPWGHTLAEEGFNQCQRTLQGIVRLIGKTAGNWQNQVDVVREQTSALTQKSLSNTVEFGQKLMRAKQPSGFAECQTEYMTRQAQAVADGTKQVLEQMQQLENNFVGKLSSVMTEGHRPKERNSERAARSPRAREHRRSRRPSQHAAHLRRVARQQRKKKAAARAS